MDSKNRETIYLHKGHRSERRGLCIAEIIMVSYEQIGEKGEATLELYFDGELVRSIDTFVSRESLRSVIEYVLGGQ